MLTMLPLSPQLMGLKHIQPRLTVRNLRSTALSPRLMGLKHIHTLPHASTFADT